ncbi:tyrosine-type recombinase/integrase [Kitasatospora sp. NPDC001540]|uniref:tyrosine-type recombinase/integrase n=1 Tax=Kitasatospora sp. NPDC001540 TaxID=3364014 RepID=UPI0036C30BBB
MPKTAASPTTGVSRRHGPIAEGLDYSSRFVGGPMTPEPAVATTPPRPFGDLSRTSALSIAGLAVEAWDGGASTRQQRGMAARAVLDYLAGYPGLTWQERWEASPVGQGLVNVNDLECRRSPSIKLTTDLRSLICLRAIQPSMLAFRRHHMTSFALMFIAAQSDPLLDDFVKQVEVHQHTYAHRTEALFDLTALLAVQGVALSDITAPALLHFAQENRRAWSVVAPGNKAGNRLRGQGVWHVLHAMGHLPPTVPATMRAALMRGQKTIEELIDLYPIRNRAVRGLLIDYFNRRRADTDYGTWKNLVLHLAHHFWEKIERINPEQADLRIAPEVYAAWRQMIAVKDDGAPRAGADGLVISVRSFYYDLHTWAAQEPEQWAVWVAPCPVPPSDLRGLGARRRRINERTADRTRQRQPLLPVLVEHVESRYDHFRQLLERAARAVEGESFTFAGTTYTRVLSDSDRKLTRRAAPVPPRLHNDDSGETVHIAAEEEAAFWDWAAVETLRHSGVRIEELCELSHLSIRQYQRPGGEVIALLVIAPSKTDRERVIPMSAELFHVIASIIRRHLRTGRPIPLVSRYDPHDKVWSPPMPFLFQRQNGAVPAVFNPGTIHRMIQRRCLALAKVHPGFKRLKFTPHDFRRIFITELVNSGLPIHIGAALLGHLNIQTTRGYVAVFDEDVIRHYQEYLQHRRQVRPEGEYRDSTPDEWSEFEEHFDRRKVELGACGRPYGTPCQHEHACIRCPMLHVNPKMLPRLNELEHDLLDRRQRAEVEGWIGEIEGIDLTLTFLRGKRDEASRRSRRPVVDLGLPRPRPSLSPE